MQAPQICLRMGGTELGPMHGHQSQVRAGSKLCLEAAQRH